MTFLFHLVMDILNERLAGYNRKYTSERRNFTCDEQ
jgi:hypothetical protein